MSLLTYSKQGLPKSAHKIWSDQCEMKCGMENCNFLTNVTAEFYRHQDKFHGLSIQEYKKAYNEINDMIKALSTTAIMIWL